MDLCLESLERNVKNIIGWELPPIISKAMWRRFYFFNYTGL